jgi:plastocyanin domain-containing protein
VADWIVVVGGVVLIGWINWYFFLARPKAVTGGATGAQSVPVTVAGGYHVDDIRVAAGTPVRLLFDRRETAPCSAEVVLPDFGMKRYLPVDRTTAVEFTPTTPGTFEFTCGMRMLRGRITVTPPETR